MAWLHHRPISSSRVWPTGVKTERPCSNRSSAPNGATVAQGARLVEHAFAIEIGAVVKVARERPGLFQGCEVFVQIGQSAARPAGID